MSNVSAKQWVVVVTWKERGVYQDNPEYFAPFESQDAAVTWGAEFSDKHQFGIKSIVTARLRHPEGTK